jgi:hypothetical protein
VKNISLKAKGEKVGEGIKANVDYTLWSSIGHFPSLKPLWLVPGKRKRSFRMKEFDDLKNV